MIKTGNGRFFTIINKICDLVMLGLIFLITSIPVITLGTSCTALYYTVTKTARFGEGKFLKEYISCWRLNFIKGCLGTCIYLILGIALIGVLGCSDDKMIMIIGIFSGILLITSFLYYFPILSRFTVSVLQCFQIALFISIHYIKFSLQLVFTLGLCIFLILVNPYLIILLAPAFAFYSSFLIEKVFKEYMVIPEEEKEQWYAEL